jgi:hypothetical protein
MRCQWTVCRTMQPDPDGQRRWDRAYQNILAWTAGIAEGCSGVSAAPNVQEDGHESGPLRPGVDTASGTCPDSPAANRAAE